MTGKLPSTSSMLQDKNPLNTLPSASGQGAYWHPTGLMFGLMISLFLAPCLVPIP